MKDFIKHFESQKFKLILFTIALVIISCNKDASDPIGPTPVVIIPEVNIQNVSKASSLTETTMQFYIYSNKASEKSVSVDYSLIDGTAISPNDYVATSGTVSIPANQTQATINIQIKGNPTDLRQPNVEFTIKLSNPKLCTIGTNSAVGTIITQNGSFLPTDNTGYTTPLSYPNYSLAWNDEFSDSSLDLNTWNQEIGNGSNGWGNNELEYYTNNLKNTFVSNGNLIIEARKESLNGFNYSSGRMTTKDKKQFKFGRIDIRAKLPVDKGIWPALWMLGSNISSVGWPACGEIDIMELIGTYPSRVSGTMHWKPVTGSSMHKGSDYNLSSGDFSQKFHVFSIIWKQDSIEWYVDDVLYGTNTKSDVDSANYPFNADQFFIFNVAVGGNWPGSPDDSTNFPQRMFVDYVRVFQ